MTFSIAGRCRQSGMLGVGITTSSVSVGARCPFARAGVGAVASQNITDPALGPAILHRLAAGAAAADALRAAMNDYPHAAYRQVTVIDRHGNTAAHAGEHMLGRHNQSAADDCVAAGNLLADATVTDAMVADFTGRDGDHLAARLLAALEAGLRAGGEEGELHSAALLVADRQPFALVDLRVDWHDRDPLGQLRALWQAYQPQMADYLTRAIDPANAPAYGVPGDP